MQVTLESITPIQRALIFDWILTCVNYNKLSEREHRKTIPFIVASKRIKYLAIN